MIIGLLAADPGSYLAAEPRWRPTLSARAGGGDFRMTDFLTFAGVDPASRGQRGRYRRVPVVARAGLEPATPRFSAVCSTN